MNDLLKDLIAEARKRGQQSYVGVCSDGYGNYVASTITMENDPADTSSSATSPEAAIADLAEVMGVKYDRPEPEPEPDPYIVTCDVCAATIPPGTGQTTMSDCICDACLAKADPVFANSLTAEECREIDNREVGGEG